MTNSPPSRSLCCFRFQTQSNTNQQSRSNSNMQIVVSAHSRGKTGGSDVPCTRLDQGTAFLSPSFRAHSVPIIPSVQGPDCGEGPGEGGGIKMHDGGGISSNPETEAESVANSSQSLASSSGTVQEPQTLESVLMSRGQIKHKSLVTYTTASGSGTGSRRAKTVISMTVLGSGAKTTQYTASLLSGGHGNEHVQSAFGDTSGREMDGDGVQTPVVGNEQESLFSAGVTHPKSWLDNASIALKTSRMLVLIGGGTPFVLTNHQKTSFWNYFTALWTTDDSKHRITDDTMWIDNAGKITMAGMADLKRYWKRFICHYLTKSFNLETK